MSLPFSVDLISDLNLEDHTPFDWTGRATSLFCVVAGNISSDLAVVTRVLGHLADCYRGIFYIDGSLEHPNLKDYNDRVDALAEICKRIEPVIYLHNHVVILNGCAFVGSNGWYGNRPAITSLMDEALVEEYRHIDQIYLTNTIKKLQGYAEVKKIVIISNSIPTEYLNYGNSSVEFPERLGPSLCLLSDSKHLVNNWLFGSSLITVDTVINDRHYCNNCSPGTAVPYWPKRIVL
jgi:hypothetical protein